MKVCINPGHAPNGNPDPGAVNSVTGLRESDVVHDIGQLIMYYLQQAGCEVTVVQNDDLQTICDTSNNMPADLFVSIHCNSSRDSAALGTEVWYCDKSINGAKLAQCIETEIVNHLRTVNRGIKDAVPHKNGLYVLTNTHAAAVLVEMAFISNSDDEAILASDEGKDKFARAIAVGITNYVAGAQ